MYLLSYLWLVVAPFSIGQVSCQEDVFAVTTMTNSRLPYESSPTQSFTTRGNDGYVMENTLLDNETCYCAAGTFYMTGACYSVNENMLTYANATKHCQRLGGNLVKFEPSENVTKLLELISSEISDVWIGLDDRDEEGLFRWIADGSELNWNMSNFRSENEDDLDCIGMDSSGDFQFLDCNTSHRAICDLKACKKGTCGCYEKVTAAGNLLNLYRGKRCILFLQARPPTSFLEQEKLCVKLGVLNEGLNGNLAMFEPWYDIKNIVMQQIQNYSKGTFFWIGLSDIEIEGNIKSRRSDLNILNERDTDFNAANIEAVDCVSINTKSGQWDYAACSKTLPFICQTEPTCEDFSESHTVMVSLVTGVVGASLIVFAVIAVTCIILKHFKASLQRFRRYKMPTMHDTPYTEVENGNDIEPSNSFINRPRIHRPLSFVENMSAIRDNNEHIYEDGESIGNTGPGIINGHDQVGSSTDNHVEITDNNFQRRTLRTANQNDVKTGQMEIPFEREIPFESSRSIKIVLNNNALQEDSGTRAEGGLTNLNDCYYEIGSNIYHEVHEMKTMKDDSYDDVSLEEREVDTPEMTYNEF